MRDYLIALGVVAVVGSAALRCGPDEGGGAPTPSPDAGVDVDADAFQPPVIGREQWQHATTALDGTCDDAAYVAARSYDLSPSAGDAVEAYIFHSRTYVYLCVKGLPDGSADAVALRVSPARSPEVTLSESDLELVFGIDGGVAASRLAADGEMTSLDLADGEIEVAVGGVVGETHNIEVKSRIARFGGYGRVSALWLGLLDDGGAVLSEWPADADASSPQTWGELVLGPLYPEDVEAGSVFIDGRRGYLTIPHIPALADMEELTVEAWVQVRDGSCGTLLGSGRDSSFWLGVCDRLQFGHAGQGSVFESQTRIDDGWHHVAVTVGDGLRAMYLDGKLESLQGYRFHSQPEPIVLTGVTDLLQVGRDSDVAEPEDGLRAHVRELRIWTRARTREEIVENALLAITEPQDGLVAVWPFTNGLEDVIGGYDAALVGDAALARDQLTIFELPPDPVPEELEPFEPPAPNDPFDGDVPIVVDLDAPIEVDGAPESAAYDRGAAIRLEPDRVIAVDLLVTPDAMYFATNLQLGGLLPTDGATIWLANPRAQVCGAACVTMPPVRIRMTPDGTVTAELWDARASEYRGEAPLSLTHAVEGDDIYEPQDDIVERDTPWWTGELAIAIDDTWPVTWGDRLQLAIRIDNSVDGEVFGSDSPEGFSAQWPADFDPDVPDSWGTVELVRVVGRESRRFDPVPYALEEGECLPFLQQWPRQQPTIGDFCANCPQFICDECLGTLYCGQPYLEYQVAYLESEGAKWPRVSTTRSYVTAEGTVTDDVHTSYEDYPSIHDSHDVDFQIDPLEPYRYLLVEGDPKLKIETESLGYPPNQDLPSLSARAAFGDHVTATGRWIFDCGHSGYTEIHPVHYIESDRQETRRTAFDRAHVVRSARVWMNSDPGAFSVDDLEGELGTLDFRLDLPNPSAPLQVLHVTEGDPSFVEASRCADDGRIHVRVHPPAPTGSYYWEMVAGSLPPGSQPAPDAFQFVVDRLEVFDDRDPPTGTNVGEWFAWINVNGYWLNLLWDRDVDSDENDDEDGAITSFNATTIPLLEGPLHIHFDGFEDDWIYAGDTLRTYADLTPIASDTVGDYSVRSDDNYWRLYYRIEPLTVGLTGGNVTPTLGIEWQGYLSDELHLIATGDTVLTVQDDVQQRPLDGFMLQGDIDEPEYFVFGEDEDDFEIWFTDFPDLSYSSAPAGVQVTEELLEGYCSHPTSCPLHCPYVPSELHDVLGSKHYRLRATANPDEVSGPYDLQVSYSRATLPEDDGESLDDASGRTLSLSATAMGVTTEDYTLDIGLCSCSANPWLSNEPIQLQTRTVQSDWAWQHVVGDEDVWDIAFPRVTTDPEPDAPACGACGSCDRFSTSFGGDLLIEAPGMYITLPELGREGANSIYIQGLADYPQFVQSSGGGPTALAHIQAIVGSAPGITERCAYRLRASWSDSFYLKFGEPGCPWDAAGVTAICQVDCDPFVALTSLPDWWWTKGPGLGDPPPDDFFLELLEGAGYARFHVTESQDLDLVVSGEPGAALDVRLYDADNVLLGQGQPLQRAGRVAADVPAGLSPATRLEVDDVEAGTYLLEVYDTAAEVGAEAPAEHQLGISQMRGGP